MHTGDRSLIDHLLNEGDAEATIASPIFGVEAEGHLNVTAAATPSILKHSPSPLPPTRVRRDEVGAGGFAVTSRGGKAKMQEATRG
jgi:hypothetical protein